MIGASLTEGFIRGDGKTDSPDPVPPPKTPKTPQTVTLPDDPPGESETHKEAGQSKAATELDDAARQKRVLNLARSFGA